MMNQAERKEEDWSVSGVLFHLCPLYSLNSFIQTLLYIFITLYPNVSLEKHRDSLVAPLLRKKEKKNLYVLHSSPSRPSPAGMRIIGGGRFHHVVLPGSIPALVCPLRSLLCASADDDPSSTPPHPQERINHLHSSHTPGEREGGGGGGKGGGGMRGEVKPSPPLHSYQGEKEERK